MPPAQAPGPLLGAGRTCDVYDVGQGRVLRRYRGPFDAQSKAQIMRHVLVDYARARSRTKRGGGVAPVPLEDVAVISDERAEEVIAVDSALEGLMAFDLRKGRIFELRHFGGLSVDEAAEVLKVSPATVARDWRMAKAWLRRAIAFESQRAD